MCDNIETPDFKDYFREYLLINYAGIDNLDAIVEKRNEEAVKKFKEIYAQNRDKDTAYEMAIARLLEGYGFSKYDFLENILKNDLADRVEECETDGLCRRFIKECDPIFSKYPLTIDYEISSSNRALRSELAAYLKTRLPAGKAIV